MFNLELRRVLRELRAARLQWTVFTSLQWHRKGHISRLTHELHSPDGLVTTTVEYGYDPVKFARVGRSVGKEIVLSIQPDGELARRLICKFVDEQIHAQGRKTAMEQIKENLDAGEKQREAENERRQALKDKYKI